MFSFSWSEQNGPLLSVHTTITRCRTTAVVRYRNNATRNGGVFHLGTLVKLDDGLTYRCQ
jgi:hypothetical protein